MTSHSGFTVKNEEAKDVEKTDVQTLRKTKLTLTLDSESMTVTHWHWQHWPDRGVPAAYLLAMRLLAKIKNDKKVLVHCSAGKFSVSVDQFWCFFNNPFRHRPHWRGRGPGDGGEGAE